MCVIETKTYIGPDGLRQTIEQAKPCPRASGSRLCNRVQYRSHEQARVIETRPETRPSVDRSGSSSDGYIVTEGTNGRTKVYRDLSKRSSGSSSYRRSNATMSERSQISSPSSASSPSYVEVKPESTSPPLATSGFTERARAPYGPPSEPSRTTMPDGTVIYGRPPSLDLPRATNNERQRSFQPDRESSFSSTTAETGEEDEPTSFRPRHRPSTSVDTTSTRPSTSSGSVSSPGLSNLPRFSDARRDSARDSYRSESGDHGKHRSNSERHRTTDEERRRREEDRRQARLEQERIAESDRRQRAREDRAREDREMEDRLREASRERHRQEAAAILEGQRDAPIQRQRSDPVPRQRDDPIQRSRDAELAQMARERHEAAQRYQRDSDEQAQRHPSVRGSSTATRRTTGDGYPYTSSSEYNMALHEQHPPPPPPVRRSSTIRERGEQVVAREQARGASERFNTALDDLGIDDDGYGYEVPDGYYVSESREPRSDRRRRRREGGRRER